MPKVNTPESASQVTIISPLRGLPSTAIHCEKQCATTLFHILSHNQMFYNHYRQIIPANPPDGRCFGYHRFGLCSVVTAWILRFALSLSVCCCAVVLSVSSCNVRCHAYGEFFACVGYSIAYQYHHCSFVIFPAFSSRFRYSFTFFCLLPDTVLPFFLSAVISSSASCHFHYLSSSIPSRSACSAYFTTVLYVFHFPLKRFLAA